MTTNRLREIVEQTVLNYEFPERTVEQTLGSYEIDRIVAAIERELCVILEHQWNPVWDGNLKQPLIDHWLNRCKVCGVKYQDLYPKPSTEDAK